MYTIARDAKHFICVNIIRKISNVMHTLHPFFLFGVCNLSLVGFVTSSRRIHTHDVISTQTFPSSVQS